MGIVAIMIGLCNSLEPFSEREATFKNVRQYLNIRW
jgi:hypothetical protein